MWLVPDERPVEDLSAHADTLEHRIESGCELADFART
jgi:hypothetical protein